MAKGAKSIRPIIAKRMARIPDSMLAAVKKLAILNIGYYKILNLFEKNQLKTSNIHLIIDLHYKECNFLVKMLLMTYKNLQLMKAKGLVIIFSLLCSMQLSIAQSDPGLTNTIAPKYSNEFLSIGVGAEALGQANAVVAQTNGVNSGYWNPAGLTHVDKWLEVGLMHSEYFAGIAKYDYLGLAHSIDEKSTIGFTAIRFAVDDIPNTTQLIDNNGNIDYDRITSFTAADYGFLFSYARKLPIKGLSVGGSFKVIHRKIGSFAKSWGFGIDAGAQYETKNKWKFGLMLRDVTSTFNAWVFTLDSETQEVFLNTGNALPENGLELTLPRIILAGYRKFDLGKKGIYASSEIDIDITTDGRRNTVLKTDLLSFDPHVGVEIGFKNYVQLRAGVSNMQFVKNFDDSESFNIQPNIGIGLNIKNFYLDYAFTDIGDASVSLYSHIVSLRIKLNKPDGLGRTE